jgi:hypothetical protein
MPTMPLATLPIQMEIPLSLPFDTYADGPSQKPLPAIRGPVPAAGRIMKFHLLTS